MKMYRLSYSIIGLLFLFPACGDNVKDLPLTQQVLEEKKVEAQLTPEERDLLAAYVVSMNMSMAFSGGGRDKAFDGKVTVGEAIEIQRAWKQGQQAQPDEEARVADVSPARNPEQEIMRDLVTVVPVRKGLREDSLNEYISLTVAITNHSDRDLKGVKGSLVARDMFGDDILAFNIKDDDALGAGVRDIRTGFYEYNPSRGAHSVFSQMDFEKMTFQWIPEMIIFADGTVITSPEL